MANIILTNSCNLKCPFCFANENNEQKRMIFDPLKSWKISSFIANNLFRFCGGEPTLTPDIINIAEALLDSGKNIMIMTNGIWPKSFHNFIQNLPHKYQVQFFYLFNILHPSFYKEKDFKKIQSNLAIVNPLNTVLGFTIYENNFEYQYLLDLAKEHRIKRLRWSIAAPNISKTDILEPYFYKISERLCEMYELCNKMGLNLVGDCNYIQPCYFQKQQLTKLLINNKITFGCSSVSPVDIGPDGMAWRCFGLYSILRKSIKDFTDERKLERYFTRRIRLLNNMLAYKECKECSYWQKGCDGGCFVYRIKKAFKQTPSLNLFPIDNDNDILKCRPYRSNDIVLKEDGEMTKIYFKEQLILEEDENTLVFLREINGNLSILDLIKLWEKNFSSYEEAVITINEKCRELFEKDYILLNYDFGIEPEERPKIFANSEQIIDSMD